MIDETWTPIFVDSAMTGPDSTSTKTAGTRVTIGASTARKASRSRTTMNRSDSCWVWFCEVAGRGDRVDLGRELAGQVDLQAGRCRRGGECGSDAVDHALGLGSGTERDHRRLDEGLARLAIARRRRGR